MPGKAMARQLISFAPRAPAIAGIYSADHFLMTLRWMRPATILPLLVSGCWLAACDLVVTPDTREVTDSAQTWLHEVDGQTLVFATAQGQTQTVRVSRREATEKESQKYGKQIPYACTYLTYRFPTVPEHGFTLRAKVAELQFVQTLEFGPRSTHDFSLFTVNTFAEEPSENSFPRHALVRNFALAGRTYPSLVQRDSLSRRGGGGPLAAYDALYYSKNHGLVAYKTLDGQLWTRR